MESKINSPFLRHIYVWIKFNLITIGLLSAIGFVRLNFLDKDIALDLKQPYEYLEEIN